MIRTKPNLYQTGKAILSEGLAVNHWWQEKDLSKEMFPLLTRELESYFGKNALVRGIKNAQDANESLPEIVIAYAKGNGHPSAQKAPVSKS